MAIKHHKIKDNVYNFNTQEDNPASATYADTDYLVSRYMVGSTWIVSSSNDPLVMLSEHSTLKDVKTKYPALVPEVDTLESVV